MRPPRRLRPRPSAPAVLPTLPPILCLLSWSWHLSQRARFPAHPFAAGSGRGRGYKGPGEEGTGVGESKALRALQPETARGRWPCPGAPVPQGGQGFSCARNTNEASRGPRPCPLRARTGRGPSDSPFAAHPPPGPARAGGAGGASSGFAARAPRLSPQPRVRVPAGTPPRAVPARAPAAPPASPLGAGGTAQRGPLHFPPCALRPAHPREASRRELRPGPAPAALAPRWLPERARQLRSEEPAAMIAGSGARALARARLGPTVPGLPAVPCAPRTEAAVAGLDPAGASKQLPDPGPGRCSCGEKF
ncbi:uncharacterized protein [Manis javanica]|uniref:uncharacterized protein n=1 Tax=Manis javanica TaxID=9974 RepID=UPI003C6D66F2